MTVTDTRVLAALKWLTAYGPAAITYKQIAEASGITTTSKSGKYRSVVRSVRNLKEANLIEVRHGEEVGSRTYVVL